MARAVGLDIGTRMIKVVELSGSPKSFKITRLAVREVPPPPAPSPAEGPAPVEGHEAPDPDAAIADVVREIFSTLKLPREDVCASFDSTTCINRDFTVPFLETDQIRKVVRFETENHLHSHSIDDVVVNWMKTGETRDGSRITSLSTPKADLSRRLALLKRAGIEPASVDLDVTALFAAYDAMGVFKEHPNVILIDLGAHSTNLVLVVEGRPQFLRTFLLGSAALEEEVSRELGVSVREGRSRVMAAAGPRQDDLLVPAVSLDPEEREAAKGLAVSPEDSLADRRQKFVKKFHLEVYRSLMGVKPATPPDRILLSGGGAMLPDVATTLGEKFGLPVERVDVLKRVDCRDAGGDPAFTTVAIPVALGCGLRMLGHNPLGIELLQDEFAPRNTFDVVRVTAATFVTLLFLVMLGLFVVAQQRLKAEKKTYDQAFHDAARIFRTAEEKYIQAHDKRTEDQAKKAVDTWFGELTPDHTRIDALRYRLGTRHRELAGNLGLAKEIVKVPSAVQVMYEVYAALSTVKPEDLGAWFQIEKMDITERQATFTIVASASSAFDTVPRLLSKSEYFQGRAKDPSPNRIVEAGARQSVGVKVRGDFQLKFKEE